MTLDISDYSPENADGSTPEAEEENPTQELEAAASEEETQAVDDESKSNKEEAEAEQPSKGRSEKLQRLIDSKGGEDKFAENIYSIFNSNKSLFKEIETLKEQIASRAVESEKPIDIDSDEDYKGFKEDIAAIDIDLQDNESLRGDLAQKFNLSRARASKYEGAMQNAEPFEKLRLQDAVEKELERQEEFKEKWKLSQKADQRLARAKSQLTSKLSKAEEKAKSVAKNQQLKANEDSRAAIKYGNIRTSIVDNLLIDAGIDITDPDQADEVEELQEAIRFRAAAKIQKSGPVDDFEAFIKDIASKYLAPYKQQTFKQLSQAKVQASKIPSKVASPAPQKPSTPRTSQGRAKAGSSLTAAQAKANIERWSRE